MSNHACDGWVYSTEASGQVRLAPLKDATTELSTSDPRITPITTLSPADHAKGVARMIR